MLTGDFEHDKAELLRLIEHEIGVITKAEKTETVAWRSRRRYEQMLRDLIRAEVGK